MRPLPRRLRVLAPLLGVALAAAACATSPTPRSAAPSVRPPPSARPITPAITWRAMTQRPTKVLVLVEENKTDQAALTGMPYLASLARTYGRASDYHAIRHPSLPNYLAIAGGSTFGVTDDAFPSRHRLTGPSVFDRAIATGHTAKTYAEAMPASCSLTSTTRYGVKHNPWAYFADAGPHASCRRFDVPMGTTTSGALRSDVVAGRLPTVGLAVPDICHDGHSCSLRVADDWLRSWLPVIFAGPDFRRGQLAVVVTFDEDDKSADNKVLTVVMSHATSHLTATSPYTHYSLSRYLSEVAGTTPLRLAARAADFRAAFHL